MSTFTRGYRSTRTPSMSMAGGQPTFDEKSTTAAPYPTSDQQQQLRAYRQNSPYAINPSFIRLLRLVLYTLSSLSAIVTAVFAILVVAYYNNHEPSIKPSWGSDIALIAFGLGTPFPLFATLLIAPRIVRRGSVAASFVGQVRSELVLLFNLTVIWISGALAMAVDLRGYENCIWDGYYHWPKPSNFRHVCDLINYTVIMGYVTFGLVALQWFVVTSIAAYILLYLDQEVLTEPAHDMGGRAYRAHLLAMSLGTDDPARPMGGGRPAPMSQQQQSQFIERGGPQPGPMAGGRLAALDTGLAGGATARGPGPMAGGLPAPVSTPRVQRDPAYDQAPRSPVRQGSTGSLDAHEFDEEGLAEFARRPSTEQPRQAAPYQRRPQDENGYVDYSRGRNPFEQGYA